METGKSYLTLIAPHALKTNPNQQTSNRLKSASKSILKTFTENKLCGRNLADNRLWHERWGDKPDVWPMRELSKY